MKKVCVILMALAMIVSCSKEKSPQVSEDKHDTIKESYNRLADSQIKIENLRKNKVVNWDEIKSVYMKNLSTVRSFDEEFQTDYENEISEAFEKCEKDEEAKVNQQIFAKGLQHINTSLIFKELSVMLKSKEKDIHVERIKALFEGIRPTFTRRDKDFFNSESTLEKAADEAISALPGIDGATYLEKAIMKTYSYSVIYEIMSIEELRDSKPEDCKVKLKEAEVFYRIIEPKIKKNNPDTDTFIQNMLRSSFENMNSAVLKEKISEIISL